MKIGMVGLGRMGANMARRLMQGGRRCVAFDLNADGIDYGLRQSYAEGFDILRHANSKELAADCRYDLNIRDIAELWKSQPEDRLA